MAFNGNPNDDLRPRISGWKVVVLIGFCAGIFGFFEQQIYGKVSAYISENPAYAEGVTILKSNDAAKAILGEPVKVDAMLSGNVRRRDNTGEATYTLAVSGSECNGVLYMRASFQNNCWALTQWVLDSKCSDAPLVLRSGEGLLTLDVSTQEA